MFFIDIDQAISIGVDIFRVASHCTEASLTKSHIEYLSKKGGGPFKNSNSNFVTAIVDDDIVIKLVKGEIDRAEEAHQSWIITGFPRTKVQALSLQRLKVIPDKFIHLNIRAETSI